MNEQLELDLDDPQYSEYTVRLFKGTLHDEQLIRSNTAKNRDGAESFIEAFMDHAKINDHVTWAADMVSKKGVLFGLAPGGVSFVITCVPPPQTRLVRD